ncbi:MAG TPA: XTP/dITP diphosphatase [Candidatus Acidoferrales bacterium]|nr:XTP/dITP diphosphatase [Candidatus Acidoferrales bacterium]
MSQRGNRKSLQLKGRIIFFATNNVNKFDEARRVLAEYNVAVGMLRVKSLEIQSESLEEIANASVLDAFDKCRLPIIVEDAGLFIDALNGFPGPYAAYAYKTVGNQGLLRLMKNIKARRAHFESAVAYFSAELKSPVCFHGEVIGKIADEETRGSGRSGFGFDPIFKPLSSSKTFAEMMIAEKNEHSHRARALRKFAEWYKS